jgi:hypothetical protein
VGQASFVISSLDDRILPKPIPETNFFFTLLLAEKRACLTLPQATFSMKTFR